jgi:hypothetical protein
MELLIIQFSQASRHVVLLGPDINLRTLVSKQSTRLLHLLITVYFTTLSETQTTPICTASDNNG